MPVFRNNLNKLVQEYQTFQEFTATTDDGGESGDSWNIEK